MERSDRVRALLSLHRQYRGEDDIVPHAALSDFTREDFERAIASFGADPNQEDDCTKEQQEEDRQRVSSGWAFDASARAARGFSLDVSGSKALLDAGYENFDERLANPTPEHVALYAGFDQQYRAASKAELTADQTLQQTLWSAYFDPLEKHKIGIGFDELIDGGKGGQVKYAPHVIEELADIFASKHIPSDAYLKEMIPEWQTYLRERWVSAVTERQFESWMASYMVFREEDTWKTLIVPEHALQYIETVHERGHLKTLVFHVKKGLLLSVVLCRHDRAAHLFKIKTHYYTFSMQQATLLLEENNKQRE